jgi:hypothetical protein
VQAYADKIEDYTGSRPVACPWFAFHDVIVGDTLKVTPLEPGQAAMLLGPNPPRIICEAVAEHEIASNRVRSRMRQKERADREREAQRRSMLSNRPRGSRG